MAASALSSNKNVVFPAIHDMCQANFLLYQQEDRKDFAIYFLQKQIAFVKIELRNKTLPKPDKLRLLNLITQFDNMLESLTDEPFSAADIYKNIEDYPPYHLHKKSQSGFEKPANNG